MTRKSVVAPLLFFAGLLPAPAADFAAGVAAYERHDYAAAIREWRPLAENGDAMSQFNLALLYYEGQGVPQNYGEAVRWFGESADRGYGKAQMNLGNLYALGRGVKRDDILAYMYLSLCAADGDAKCAAQRDLVAAKLKPSKLAEAQRRAQQWRKKE